MVRPVKESISSKSQSFGARRLGRLVIPVLLVGFAVVTYHLYNPSCFDMATADLEKTHEESALPFLDLPPSTREIVMNIGSNKDPILPKKTMGPCALSIAFEPIVPHLIPAHPQVFAVPAAVAATSYLATMYAFNNDGVSSSLNKPASDMFWNTGKFNQGIRIVPVMAIKNVIQAIPPNVKLDFIKTDAQGHDFTILKAVIKEISERGVGYLQTEVWYDNTVTYEGVDNDLCLHWMPFMAKNGYTLVGIVGGTISRPFLSPKEVRDGICGKQNNNTRSSGLKETDALWQISTDPAKVDQSVFEYPIHNGAPPIFSTKEYATCK